MLQLVPTWEPGFSGYASAVAQVVGNPDGAVAAWWAEPYAKALQLAPSATTFASKNTAAY
jgi:hypothetical protein